MDGRRMVDSMRQGGLNERGGWCFRGSIFREQVYHWQGGVGYTALTLSGHIR
jgi:hypothetical protein